MNERLIDVKNKEKLLHTFPVTVDGPAAEKDEDAFKRKALDAAAHAKVVPDAELKNLEATMHIGRRGQLEPYGDPLGVLAETKEGLEQAVRERAFGLWEQEGRPEGRAEEFWHRAQHQHWCERAYALWEREGWPQGKADEHWHRVRNFERT